MYKVNYSSSMSYVSNYFYCHIQPEGMFCDAEHDLLAIAKLFVTCVRFFYSSSVLFYV